MRAAGTCSLHLCVAHSVSAERSTPRSALLLTACHYMLPLPTLLLLLRCCCCGGGGGGGELIALACSVVPRLRAGPHIIILLTCEICICTPTPLRRWQTWLRTCRVSAWVGVTPRCSTGPVAADRSALDELRSCSMATHDATLHLQPTICSDSPARRHEHARGAAPGVPLPPASPAVQQAAGSSRGQRPAADALSLHAARVACHAVERGAHAAAAGRGRSSRQRARRLASEPVGAGRGGAAAGWRAAGGCGGAGGGAGGPGRGGGASGACRRGSGVGAAAVCRLPSNRAGGEVAANQSNHTHTHTHTFDSPTGAWERSRREWAGGQACCSRRPGARPRGLAWHPTPHHQPPPVCCPLCRRRTQIINSILTSALPRNPELVYTLLHRQVGCVCEWTGG